VQLLNFILDEVAAALARGEEKEFPSGSLKRARHPHKKKRGGDFSAPVQGSSAMPLDSSIRCALNRRLGIASAETRGHLAPGLI